MAQHDIEPLGRWEQLIQPMRNKFSLHADLGLETRLDPDAGKAAADAFVIMARYIDLMEAHEKLTIRLFKMLGVTLLLIAAFALLVYLG